MTPGTRHPPPVPGSRRWANLSLIAGGLWLVLSVTPFFLTTLLGLPFAALAFATGWWARRGSAQTGDPAGQARANWGLGLGCAGCAWQLIYYSLVAGVLAAAAPSLFDYLRQLLGTPTP